MSEEENLPAPNWLVKLEEQRAKRLKAKLGHEAGAGAPCQNCGEKCPGLDLHFWRKICKICKCGKEDHDISDDDYMCGYVQETLLGSRPLKAKNIFLRGQKDAVTLDWTPKGSNTDVKKYLDELPEDLLPVKGSEAARLRKQRLQKQMPAHDIDASLCHALTPEEIQQLEEYVAHIRKHSVGQGKVIQLSLLKGHKFGHHTNPQFLTQYTPAQLASSQTVHLQASDIVNNLHNLSLHPNYVPQSIHQIVDSQNPVSVGKTSDLIYPVHSFQYPNAISAAVSKTKDNIHDAVASSKYGENKNPEFAKKFTGYAQDNPVAGANNKNSKSMQHSDPHFANELLVEGVLHDGQFGMKQQGMYGMQNPNINTNAPYSEFEPVANAKYGGKQPESTGKLMYGSQNPNFGTEIENFNTPFPYSNQQQEKYGNIPANQAQYFNSATSDAPVQYPLTTTNVELHQEQFLEPSANEFKNRTPLPVLNAQNVLNPLEYEQSMSSVGYIRDIDYNRPALQPSGTDPNSNNLLINCHKCSKPFDDGSIAVSADRTKSLWHPGCFTCRTCSQPLADLLYFYHKDTDDIYCGRDYALLKGIPRCAACDELIFVREYCLAEGSTFHVKHFCCFECDEPLAGKQYVMENNQPVCVDCYEQLKAEKCNDCGYVIRPDQQGVSLQDLHWHAEPDCFACKNCRKSLLGAKLLLRNKNLFCSDICHKSYH